MKTAQDREFKGRDPDGDPVGWALNPLRPGSRRERHRPPYDSSIGGRPLFRRASCRTPRSSGRKTGFFRRLGLETGLSPWYAEATKHTTCRETAPCPWESSYQRPGTGSRGNFSPSSPGRSVRRGRRTAGSWPCRASRRSGGISITATAASGTLPPTATRWRVPSRPGRCGTSRPRGP